MSKNSIAGFDELRKEFEVLIAEGEKLNEIQKIIDRLKELDDIDFIISDKYSEHYQAIGGYQSKIDIFSKNLNFSLKYLIKNIIC